MTLHASRGKQGTLCSVRERARGLRPLDRVLIATLVPLFLVVLVLQLREGLATDMAGFLMSLSSARAGDFPIVESVNPLYPPRFEGRSLEVGDRLVRLGKESLLGASNLDARTRLTLAARRPEGARLEVARGNERFSTTLFPAPPLNWWETFHWWVYFPGAVAGALTSLILLLRAQEWPGARSYFVCSLFGGVEWVCGSFSDNFVGFGARYLFIAAYPVFIAGTVSTYWRFTPSALPLNRWQSAQIAVFFVLILAALVGVYWLPRPVGGRLAFAFLVALVVGALASALWGVTRAYRRSDALERRQIRWALYGVYLSLLPFVAEAAAALLGREGLAARIDPIAPLVAIAAPAGLLVAFFGYRFLDVDPLISATTSLTVLGVLLHEVVVHVIPEAAETVSHATGFSPTASKWTLSLAFVAVVLRAHGRLRPWIDRRLFGARVSVEGGLAQLIVELAGCRSAKELTELSAERLDALFKPESLVVYARAESAFEPVFARGRAVPAAIASDGPLVHILESRTTPLAARAKEIDPLDRAVVETLDTEVLIPIRRAGTLAAFTCLGRKRSRDIYSPAELALLKAVATANSEALQHLGDAEVIEQARAMQASLRRYVPVAIAEHLERGRDLEPTKREVTALFIDLRDTASDMENVFSTVNASTERVSRIVVAHGGSVVEVNGEGMLAVFGAPEALAERERRAVEAAREIVDSSPPDLQVGIGIATGAAYAGSIRAADRWIWSVIGDATVLAARLQATTRSLGASIVMDEPSRRAAGYVCADFARHAEVKLQGRPVDVFALPVARPAVA